MAIPHWLRVVLNLPDPKVTSAGAPSAKAPRQRRGSTAAPAGANPYLAARPAPATPWQPEERQRNAFLTLLRGLLLVVLGLALITGLRTWVRPTKIDTTAQIPATMHFPHEAASGAALRFGRAYLAWDGTVEAKQGTRAKALADAGWGGDPRIGWNGQGRATVADLTVADVEAATATSGTVTLTGLWSTYDAKNKPTTRRIGLRVPVALIQGQMAVTGAPAFVSPPRPVRPPNAAAAAVTMDSQITSETKEDARAFFAAYGADDDLTAITAPGSTIQGLAGSVKLVEVTKWRVAAPSPADPSKTSAYATVAWQMGSGSTVHQEYVLQLTQTTAGAVSRWQVASLISA